MFEDLELHQSGVDIWAGLECTLNRVGDTYRDQLSENGHYYRKDDLRLIASLGVSTMRYPLLWEKHQPQADAEIDWSWAETQLGLMKSLEITPIVGLVHHGSGPVFTDLLDEGFAEKLAAYALKVAQRFPGVTMYTPVNEPLTTARFSGLYGLWYPHKCDDTSFLLMLINQVKGIVLSMQEIRKINPDARLIQTEDLAMTHSSPMFAAQATFENHRRWLTNDLLLGKVDKSHPLWDYFIDNGIQEDKLLFFVNNPTPPDIIGWNYYATSERYLVTASDGQFQGFSGTALSYEDQVAVRHGKARGLKSLLIQAFNRYQFPMAITECHLSCSREEQLRWFKEVWEACNDLKKSGFNLRAVTSWSVMGAIDWNSLVTQDNKFYESGAFDISGGMTRPTALAGMIKTLLSGRRFDHPLLYNRGWWDRNQRRAFDSHPQRKIAPLLLIGERRLILEAFERACEQRAITYKSWGRGTWDQLDGFLSNKNLPAPWGAVLFDEEHTSKSIGLFENNASIELLSIESEVETITDIDLYVSEQLDLFIDRAILGRSGLQYAFVNPVEEVLVYQER
ncbi:MAG: family 1 glycosylhydrolase [Chitinophagaceae bacterium]